MYLIMVIDSCAALDFPMYDASALANDAETKLSGIIKQVSHCYVWQVWCGLPGGPYTLQGGKDSLVYMRVNVQAEELKAYSEKRMKELEKEIQDCEHAKVDCCLIALL